jgi:hypothetical protein
MMQNLRCSDGMVRKHVCFELIERFKAEILAVTVDCGCVAETPFREISGLQVGKIAVTDQDLSCDFSGGIVCERVVQYRQKDRNHCIHAILSLAMKMRICTGPDRSSYLL